jgi:hypothetical protein
MSLSEDKKALETSRFRSGDDDPYLKYGSSPAKRDAANAALLELARQDFARIAALSEDSYSRDLKERNERLSRYIQENKLPGKGAAYLDPNHFDTALGLGYVDYEAMDACLAAQNIKVSDDVARRAASGMLNGPSPSLVPESHSPRPMMVSDIFSTEPQFHVLIPSAGDAPAVEIKGLTEAQTRDFINRHEAWHAVDGRFSVKGVKRKDFTKLNLDEPETCLGNPEQLKAVSIKNKKECFADVGALGDMIREDAAFGTSLLDNAAAARQQEGNDVTHYTVKAITALKQKINEMGIDNFRALKPDEARKLYEDIADANSMSPDMAGIVIEYRTGSEAYRRQMTRMATTDPRCPSDIKEAVNFAKPYRPEIPERFRGLGQPLSRKEKEVIEKLGKWDAVQILEDRAFKNDGKITPATLARAYGELRTELLEQMRNKPGDLLLRAQSGKLQASYITTMQSLDYVGENRARGVDIFTAEPALTEYLGQREKKTAPAPSKPSKPEEKPGGRTVTAPKVG